MLVNAGLGILSQVISLFGERGKKGQEMLKAAQENMQRTWTDEIIVVIFIVIPALVAWKDPVALAEWIKTMFETSELYAGMVLGIVGSVFALGKIKGRK